jgi:signal transduction histidine kinase
LERERVLKDKELAQSNAIIALISGLSILFIIAMVLYNSRRQYKLKEALAIEKEQLLKSRFKATLEAEEKERKRIAQELHDGLGQLLSIVRINVAGIGEVGGTKAKNSLSLIDQSIAEVRTISHNLMPNALVSVGLKSALQGLVHKINSSGQIQATLNMKEDVVFSEAKTIGVYRIIQEVMNNAIKYAKSPKLTVTIWTENQHTFIEIKDEGVGFDTSQISQSSGIGWSNIFSRVELMAGKINIYSKFDQGTTVKIELPHDGEHDQAAVG